MDYTKVFVLLLIAFGTFHAVSLDLSLQPIYYTHDFFFTGNINCQGDGACELTSGTNVTCSMVTDNVTYNYAGAEPFKFMVSADTNGQKDIFVYCNRGEAVADTTVSTFVYERTILYILLAVFFLLLPYAMLLWALWELLSQKLHFGIAMLSLGTIIVKYLLGNILQYLPYMELWNYDWLIFVLFFFYLFAAVFVGNKLKAR